jgi:hypothetical protein
MVDVLGVHTGSCEAIELATRHHERVRRVALVGLLAFTSEEACRFRREYRPAPAPNEDGSHLLSYWRRWLAWRASAWGLEDVQRCVLDSLRSGARSRSGLDAVLSYPTAERATDIQQPLLVYAPTDYVWENTQRGLASLPAQARVVHVTLDPPGSTPVALFSHRSDELAPSLLEFLDGK